MNKIIEIAEKEIGYAEKPINKTKYGEWFGFDGAKWCGIFVSWVYYHAGFPLGKIDFWKGFASCQYAFNHFIKTNEITDNPQVGDIVLFDFDGDGDYEHTGIVTAIDIDTRFIHTIEGNTSGKDQTNGGMVERKMRPLYTCKFIHPKILDK